MRIFFFVTINHLFYYLVNLLADCNGQRRAVTNLQRDLLHGGHNTLAKTRAEIVFLCPEEMNVSAQLCKVAPVVITSSISIIGRSFQLSGNSVFTAKALRKFRARACLFLPAIEGVWIRRIRRFGANSISVLLPDIWPVSQRANSADWLYPRIRYRIR